MGIPLFLGSLVMLLPVYGEATRMMGGIIGGRTATPHSHPYMALLHVQEADGLYFCDGFLIREDFVMTAGHCGGRAIEVLLGVHDTKKEPSQKIRVKHQVLHPDYDKNNYENDIMLLKLSHNATISPIVKTIDLPVEQDAEAPPLCLVSGWGRLTVNNSKMPNQLQEVNVTINNSEKCVNKIYVRGTVGPAQGDSGGPLVCTGVAHGVVSFFEIFEKDIHFVFTKISHYLPWIHKEMKK